ncbi:MAG: hypothetical protein H6704_30670 [Myxococcales bacterium]|nr:hypothetical protein [Myxococcales bacterium]
MSLRLQSKSSQSVKPSPSLSTASPHRASVFSGSPLPPPLPPQTVMPSPRLQSKSSQSVKPSPSLSTPSSHRASVFSGSPLPAPQTLTSGLRLHE